MDFTREVLNLEADSECAGICDFIRRQTRALRRKGAVVGLSGGIDSALCAALCVEALGEKKVFGLILPEKDSSPSSRILAEKQADRLGIDFEVFDITAVLESLGAYRQRDRIVREIYPGFSEQDRFKIVLPGDLLNRESLNFFKLIISDTQGRVLSFRPKKAQLDGIIAATSMKQRTRMIRLYNAAEKRAYLVCGTTNRSETIQGFFVKYGDGGVDLEPLAHLYKTQVYALSRHLGVIPEIIARPPSPDTYSFEVSDEEFYFRMPYDTLDLLLYAWENRVPAPEAGRVLDLSEAQVTRAFNDFSSKYQATAHLRQLPPALDE